MENSPLQTPPQPQIKMRLLRNILTVGLLISGGLFFVPLLLILGLIAVWTIAPWNRLARIIVTAVFIVPALYYPAIVLFALLKAALF